VVVVVVDLINIVVDRDNVKVMELDLEVGDIGDGVN